MGGWWSSAEFLWVCMDTDKLLFIFKGVFLCRVSGCHVWTDSVEKRRKRKTTQRRRKIEELELETGEKEIVRTQESSLVEKKKSHK